MLTYVQLAAVATDDTQSNPSQNYTPAGLLCNPIGILYVAPVISGPGGTFPFEQIPTSDIINDPAGFSVVNFNYLSRSQTEFAPARSLAAGWMNPTPGNMPNGVTMAANPAEWSLAHTPAVGVRATITRAAVANARHVCRSISATLSVAVADVAVAGVLVNLRDGATGAGTILWSKRLAIIDAAGGLAQVELAGLNITGSVNTAMTLEFAAAPGGASFEDVAISGYTVL